MKTFAKSKQARLLAVARGVKQAVLGISPEGWQIVAGG